MQLSKNRKNTFLYICSSLIVGICLFNVGCAAVASNLLHAIYGHDQPPEYAGLKKQRIAILAANEQGIMRDSVTHGIAGTVRMAMAGKLKKASFVTDEEMNRWLIDVTDRYDAVRNVGKGVNADVVIMVKISNMKLMDGKTMYRGVSDVDVELYDVEQDKTMFTKSLPAYTYPQAAAISTTEMDIEKFQKLYVMTVGERVSRYFVSHPMGSGIAEDAKILEFQ